MKSTTRQREVLEFIEAMQARCGIVPTTREIQEHFGFASQTSAMNYLKALEKSGAISRIPGKARAVSVLAHAGRARIVDVPLFGQIAAGMGDAEMTAEPEGFVSIDAASVGLSGDRAVFALKVRGDSMVDAAICDGDLVILEKRAPRHQDVVAALIDGETTLKRYLCERGQHPYLHAENPRFPDLIPARELLIQGVMVGLVRKC